MRKVVVPVDMQSEQKELFGVISKRQLFYLGGGGALVYWYIPIVFNLFPSWVAGTIACIVSLAPTATLVYFLAFHRLEKYHMFIDKYVLIRLQYRSQLGIWRRGSNQTYNTEDFYNG